MSGEVPPQRDRQNSTIHQGITYNALAIGITGGANTLSSAGGALTNNVTSTTNSGNTATPPPTHSIDTRDHNRCNTYNYRFKDSQRNYPKTREATGTTSTTSQLTTSHEWLARNRPPTKRRPRPAPTQTTPTPSDHHETRQPPSITCDTLTVGNTSDTNTHGTIHTTADPTNDMPRYITYNVPTITTTTPAQSNTYSAPTVGVTKDASRAGKQTPPAPPTGPPARGSNSTH